MIAAYEFLNSTLILYSIYVELICQSSTSGDEDVVEATLHRTVAPGGRSLVTRALGVPRRPGKGGIS